MSDQDTHFTHKEPSLRFISTMSKVTCKVYYISSSSSLRYGNGFYILRIYDIFIYGHDRINVNESFRYQREKSIFISSHTAIVMMMSHFQSSCVCFS
jgi:hypothetical protein